MLTIWQSVSEAHLAQQHLLVHHRRKKSCDWRRHTSPPLTVFISRFDCSRISGGFWFLSTQPTQTNQARQTAPKNKQQPVKVQLSSLHHFGLYPQSRHTSWLTHTHTQITRHISLCLCKQRTSHFLWLFHNQRMLYTYTDCFLQPNKHCVHCLCWYKQHDWAQSCCWWSDPATKSLCGLTHCLCAAVTLKGGTVEEDEDEWGSPSVCGQVADWWIVSLLLQRKQCCFGITSQGLL